MVEIEQSADGRTISCSCESITEETEMDSTLPVISCTCDREDDPSFEIKIGPAFVSYEGIAEWVRFQQGKWDEVEREDKMSYRAYRPYDEKEIEITTIKT